MFKQKEETIENKNKDAGFVDDKGDAISKEAEKSLTAQPEPNPNDVNLNAQFTYDDQNLEQVEKDRNKFLKIVKKQNIIKWIVSIISIGLLVFAFIFFLNNNQFKNNNAVRLGGGIGVAGAGVAVMIGWLIFNKKYSNKYMNEYLKTYYGCMNAFVFGNERFKDVHGDIAGKISNDDFNKAETYKDVSTIGSRNVINFKIDGKINTTICDCAAQQTTVKKLVPLFIGKYLIADNTYKGNEPIIVYLTGNSRALPPNNVAHLPKVVNTKNMIVYTNNKGYASMFTSKVKNTVSKLITNNVLVDAFISIQKGKTYIGLGYDDCLMILPLNDKFNPIPIRKFKDDMQIVADIIVGLNN